MQAVAELGEPELISMAAKGDREAQAQLTVRCILKQDFSRYEALALAEPFARMAAAHGLIEDRLMLAAVLRVRARHIYEGGELERASHLLAFSRTLCEDFTGVRLCLAVEYLAAVLIADSDFGDAHADTLLSRLMSSLTATDADELRQRVNVAVKDLAALELVHG